MAPNHKTFVFKDVAKHNKTKDCWVIIYGKVYDVTSFMEDHPGGSEVILASTGKDGTFDFENAGHSDEARELMPKYYIGEVDQSTVPAKHSVVMSAANTIYTSEMSQQNFIKILQFLVPVMILGLVFTVKA